ncbi:MAG: hypothetical protein Q4A74_05380 [Cardiobacteriaceae bacterium]|nr:hypothetical protein [Cardiobacteriaceae bacterium]
MLTTQRLLASAALRFTLNNVAALINIALKDATTPLGVSYKHRDDLAAFWQALAFTEIHRSPSGHSLRLQKSMLYSSLISLPQQP